MGFIGNLLGSGIDNATSIGSAVGQMFGDREKGRRIGSAIQGSGLGGLARLLPFQEGGMVVMAKKRGKCTHNNKKVHKKKK